MNKKILNTLLVLTPKKLQNKAVAKALNFLLPDGFFPTDEQRMVEFCLLDLKRNWILQMDQSGFQAVSSRKPQVDIQLSAELDTVFASQDSRKLQHALEQGTIEVNATQRDTARVVAALSSITQEKLDELIAYGYRFFKLTPKPRIDIRTVTFEDIRIAKDVDFIRDEAIKLEKTDLKEALRLMEIAHRARPKGPFIEKKVSQYRATLKSL